MSGRTRPRATRSRGRAVTASVAVAAIAFAAGAGTLEGQTITWGADASIDSRLFPDRPGFSDQAAAHVSPSVAGTFEVLVEPEEGSWWLEAEGFGRIDADDRNRTHFDMRELGVGVLGSDVSAFVGIGQAFWGVTEVAHLVDIVNQTDGVEGLRAGGKLGQPMVRLTLEGGTGALDVFYLPYGRQRTFPAPDARLRGPMPIADDATYASDRGAWHPTFAARGFRTFGPLDVGLSGFRGTAREPRFAPHEGTGGAPLLRPHYDLIDQVGVDVQWTGEQTLLKLEAMTRGGHADRIYALTSGFEHTLYQILGSDGDLGLLGEFMLDSRGPTAPPTAYDRDVFLGARWARNDVADTSLLGGPVIDLRTGELLLIAEGARRIGSVWRFEADVRLFANTAPHSPVRGIGEDGYVSLSLTRYF